MSARTPSCVLLADRHYRLSEGVRGLLDTAFNRVFMVADQTSLMEGAERLSPELVIVDISLAQGGVEEMLGSIREHAPAAKVLVLSVHDEPTVVDVRACGRRRRPRAQARDRHRSDACRRRALSGAPLRLAGGTALSPRASTLCYDN